MADEMTPGQESDGTGADEAPTGSKQSEQERRSLYRHPLAAVGGALLGAGVFAFVVLVVIDLTSGQENPYRSLVTFIAVPAVITIGALLFLLAIRIQVVQARRRGEKVRFNLRIEPSDPKYMRNLWLFVGLLAALVLLVGFSSFKAYEATDSVAFCGEACHTVMEPQAVTYQNSPHARVPCAECHIGPGASFWVRSKVDGLRQVWRTMTNSYDRPVATPIENLRPAQETCEQCHWPDQFYGQKLVNTTYYMTDEGNSPWSISLLVNVGGGNPRTGALEGIHWHMVTANSIEYIATDHDRQDIPWVRITDQDGNVTVYSDPESDVGPETEDLDVRSFDCIDCHNRPSHHFLPPATAMNIEMSKGAISTELPYVRRVGLELLNADYDTRDEANEAIVSGLDEYYRLEYPGDYDALRAEIEQASETLLDIYNLNFFPEMETDYRVRTDNRSHFVNEGCFRCHGTELQSETGQTITDSCEACHAIVAQGPSDDLAQLTTDLNGLEFQHPVEIGGAWQTIRCTQCHTPAQGY